MHWKIQQSFLSTDLNNNPKLINVQIPKCYSVSAMPNEPFLYKLKIYILFFLISWIQKLFNFDYEWIMIVFCVDNLSWLLLFFFIIDSLRIP